MKKLLLFISLIVVAGSLPAQILGDYECHKIIRLARECGSDSININPDTDTTFMFLYYKDGLAIDILMIKSGDKISIEKSVVGTDYKCEKTLVDKKYYAEFLGLYIRFKNWVAFIENDERHGYSEIPEGTNMDSLVTVAKLANVCDGQTEIMYSYTNGSHVVGERDAAWGFSQAYPVRHAMIEDLKKIALKIK